MVEIITLKILLFWVVFVLINEVVKTFCPDALLQKPSKFFRRYVYDQFEIQSLIL